MLTRGNVEALSKKLENPKAEFDAALTAAQVEQAAAIAMAALLTNRPFGVADLAKIAADVSLPDVLLPLFARAPGSIEQLLPTLELDEHRRALILTAQISKTEGKAPAWLVDALCDQLVLSIGDASYELLVACAYQLDDPAPFKMRHSVRTYLNAADAREVWATVKRDIARPLAIIPEQELSLPVVPVKKSNDGPSRNDPCPCGSGQKYKKCHGAEGGLETKGRAERLAELLPVLDTRHVAALTAVDLRSIDLSKVPFRLGLTVFREWLYRQRWHEAEVALEALCVHPDRKDTADGYRDELIWLALQSGRLEDAQRQWKKVEKPEALTPVLDVHAALLKPWPAWFEQVEDLCADAAQTGELLDLTELTFALLKRAPGLGVWLASALINRTNALDAQTMFESMDDARDRLGLPSLTQRESRAHVRVTEKKKPAAKKADPKEKAKLRALETTLEESKRKMRQIEQELEKEKSKASAEPAAPVHPPGARKAFAQRIDELEDRIREGNAERAALRREVADLTERLEQGKEAPAPAKAEVEADDPGESATRPRGLMLAQWEPRAVESLEELPARVAEDVLVKVAELGSGDAAHWIEVKQLQGVAGLYTTRIGIHYRALFTIEDKLLRVHEVVHREGFDTALRRFK